jgi:hypothetical protein
MRITNYQGLFIENRVSHPVDLVAEHSFDFVAHGFPASGVEMDSYPVGGFPDLFHKHGAFLSMLWHRNLAVRGADVNFIFSAHITPFVSKPSIHRTKAYSVS